MKKDMDKLDQSQIVSLEVKKIFPGIKDPVLFGQLFGITEMGMGLCCPVDVIKQAGLWWLEFRNLGIQNMITNEIKHAIRKTALLSLKDGCLLTFVTTRSPDFILHFTEQKSGKPKISERSIKAIHRVSEIRKLSTKFLPTRAIIFLADIALANADDPNNSLVSATATELLDQNLIELERAILGIDPEIETSRLGDLIGSNGQLISSAIGFSGNVEVALPPTAFTVIKPVVSESLEFHQNLGWSEKDVWDRTEKLAKCMAIVGKTFHDQTPKPIMLFMESFVKRSSFNNLLNDRRDPLPIICFNDLKR